MATTIRINEDVKQQLKIKSAELGIKQTDLLNRYVLEGIKRDQSKNKPHSVEEIAEQMNIKLTNKLDDLDYESDIEVDLNKEPLSIDEMKKAVQKSNDGTPSKVNLYDVVGIVQSPEMEDYMEEKYE